MTLNKARTLLFATTSLGVLSAGEMALAQSSSSSSMLEEVIVQARRTDERAQDVPVAVTPLGAQVLQDRRIANFNDLQFNVAGLSFNQSLTRNFTRVQMRGQTEAYGSDFPGVDTLFADVPLQVGGSAPLYDLASVQALKGPQGVAFGRNSTGGAILFYPVRPDNQTGGYVSATVSNFNGREFEAAVNIPIVPDVLMVRAAGKVERRDGWTKNLTTGSKLDDRHSDSWRISALWKPTEYIENYTVLSGFKIDTLSSGSHIYAYNPTGLIATLYAPPLWPGPSFISQAEASLALGRDATLSNGDGVVQATQLFFANTTTFDISDSLRLKNVFGYQRMKRLNTALGASVDMDGTPLEIIRFGVPVGEAKAGVSETFSNEFQVQGEGMDGRLRWLAGLFTSQQLPDSAGDPVVALTGQPFFGRSATITLSKARSWAPFAQVTLPLDMVSDRLSLTLGARHTWDERSYAITTIAGRSAANPAGAVITCPPAASTCTLVGGTPTLRAGGGKFKGWNYAVTLDYKASDDLLVYAAHRHGFKGGSFNANSSDPAFLLVKPEYIDDIEVGLKSDWEAGGVRGRLNAAIYYQWYKDIVRTTFQPATAQTLNRNVAKATIQGAEIEATVIPFDGLELSAFYAYTYGMFRKSLTPIAIKRFPDIPVNKISFSARYELPIDPDLGRISLLGQIYYQSEHYLDQNATVPQALADGYTLVNLQLDWKDIAGSKVDASLYVKNLTDKVYWLGGADIYNDFGFVQGIYGEPRSYGLQLRYDF